jgi:hypothetical protein
MHIQFAHRCRMTYSSAYAPRPLSPKGARGEITRVYALAPLGERVSVSRRTGEGVGHDIT